MNKNIKLLITASAVSDVGNWINRLAVLQLAYEMYGSDRGTSIISLAMMVPMAVLGRFAGKFADKYNRKKIMLMSAAFRTFLVILLFLFPSYLIALTLISSTFAVFSDICEDSIVPELVDYNELARVNSIYSAVSSVIMIAGPSVGGVIVSAIGIRYAFLIDAASFLGAILLISFIYYNPILQNSNGLETHRDIDNDGKKVKINEAVKGVIIGNCAIGLSSGMLNSMLIVYVYDILKKNTSDYGMLLSVKGIVMVATAAISTAIITKINISQNKIYMAGLMGMGICTLVFSMNKIWAIALLVQSMNGFFNTIFSISKTTIIQQNTDDRTRGKVMGLNSSLISITSLTSIVFFGWIAGFVNVAVILSTGGVMLILTGILLTFRKYVLL